jgi:hypothetical protein
MFAVVRGDLDRKRTAGTVQAGPQSIAGRGHHEDRELARDAAFVGLEDVPTLESRMLTGRDSSPCLRAPPTLECGRGADS